MSARILSHSLGSWELPKKKSAWSDMVYPSPKAFAFWQNIQRIFEIYKGKIFPLVISFFLNFLNIVFGQIACTSECNYICHAILPIWVSFNSSGPKECNLQSRFGLKNYLMWKKLKLIIEIFFLSKFRKYFVYFAKKQQLWGKGKPCPIRLKFFLVVLMTLENGIRFLLTCFETLFYFGQFCDTLVGRGNTMIDPPG